MARKQKQKRQESRNDEPKAESHEPQEEKPKYKAPALSVPETCELIAELCESIVEDPDKAFVSIEVEMEDGIKRKGPSRMQQLLMVARRQNDANDRYTAQLAIVSLLAVFKDILPDYRIRVPTAKEMAVKVAKETKKVWDYERGLLHHYQEYLKLLEKTWDQGDEKDSVAVTAIISLSELLKSSFHFNFRSNLIAAVVREMSCPIDSVRNACCESVQHVFSHDKQGDVSLEATRHVAKIIKSHHFKVHPQVLQTFVSLPLRVHADEAEAAKLATQANAKKRKRDKEASEIEAELREGRATVDKLALARFQSDTLQAVTLTYFRILKAGNLKSFYTQRLLPVALEGLAKFAHLINIDTVMDVLEVLKGLLERVDLLPLDAALNCILTAMLTLQGPGREMNIDQKEYITPLYNQLPRLCTEEKAMRNTEVVLRCLTAAFIQRREFSTVRVAAFLKRILATAMHLPPHSSIPLVAFTRQLIQRYPSAEQMLENEQDVITSGVFQPHVEDPEHSNPFATSSWELAMLRFHWNAGVVHQANGAAAAKMLNMPTETPGKLRAAVLRDEENLYIPFKRLKKEHPLRPKANAKRTQARFIKPREFESIIEGTN